MGCIGEGDGQNIAETSSSLMNDYEECKSAQEEEDRHNDELDSQEMANRLLKKTVEDDSSSSSSDEDDGGKDERIFLQSIKHLIRLEVEKKIFSLIEKEPNLKEINKRLKEL